MKTILTILILTTQINLWSCSCAYVVSEEKSNLELSVEGAVWIGIGIIVKANKESYPAIYTMEVSTLFKGDKGITQIQTGHGGPDCGFKFEVGEEYIVYGVELNESTIETNRCTRTSNIKETADYDYLNKRFIDDSVELNWTESFTNFIQVKIGTQIDVMNPPIMVEEKYQILSVEDVIHGYPNFDMKRMSFDSKEQKKMDARVKELYLNNGILLMNPRFIKLRKRKLIRKLNKELN